MTDDIASKIQWYKDYHRLTNYISAAQLYLKDNFLVEENLKSEHIKNRILGHWGTVPGINFVYAGLNFLVKKYSQNLLFVNGPGHGAPAILSNFLLEGALAEYYPEYTVDLKGISKLIKDFSWPLGFPSHTYPGLPGTILEGGELGYSLSTAFGAAFDNPDLMVACLVGDGEAETGTLATSWHSSKFLNPIKDGLVLPILHLNGYRISGPTIFGTMSEKEINMYFQGLGYTPLWVDYRTSVDIYVDMLETLIKAYELLQSLRNNWNAYTYESPTYPVIILRTPKGWTGPKFIGDKKLEDNNYSHGIPLEQPKTNQLELEKLQEWLKSYKVHELLTDDGEVNQEILATIPTGELRIGLNKHALGGNLRKDLVLPKLEDHAIRVFKRGMNPESNMVNTSQYFRDIFSENESENNFRIFSPDESESNMMSSIFAETGRRYLWPIRRWDEFINPEGRIMEVLSENLLMGWMQGYILTGRHGVLVSYEAFLNIITSQLQQYIKFMTKSKLHNFRTPLPSLNLLATSTTWRQDHNGFSHQNPALINSLLNMQSSFVNIYFPVDVNTLICTLQECLKSTNKVNLIISGKRDLPQWLHLAEAQTHVTKGVSIWNWAGNEDTTNPKPVVEVSSVDDGLTPKEVSAEIIQPKLPDVVMVSIGDYQNMEMLAASAILKKLIPELKFRFININELSKLGFGDTRDPINSPIEIEALFPHGRDIVINFHGYPEVIKQLTWGLEISSRMKILGYIEQGTTTTPFDMQVQNGTSRYHVCMEVIRSASKVNEHVKSIEADLLYYFERKLQEHKEYILAHGDDMPEVKQWKWDDL